MSGGGVAAPPATIFFLSDYGLADEFVGVVHAVLLRLSPGATVVDLTHGIPPFDVRAGAEALARAVPHLGPGPVLGVVDPGVGGDRRGVAVESAHGRWFVGPDNGLLVPAATRCGGVRRVVVLHKPADAAPTFDGRDVFAPAAALLSCGGDPASLGDEAAAQTLVALAPPVVSCVEDGARRRLTADVTWVDRFGNVQLAAGERDGPGLEATVVDVVLVASGAGPRSLRARWVRTFSELAAGELGLLADASGRLALAVREGSAAAATRLAPGDTVELGWEREGAARGGPPTW